MRLRADRAILLASVFASANAGAQTTPTLAAPASVAPASVSFTFRGFLQQVGQANFELLAQRSTLPIAQAQIAIARVFPDPQITAGLLQVDVTNGGNQTATIVQIAAPIQVGGQRAARIALAEASLSATEAELDDFLRGLRATAANAYVDSLHARLIAARKRRTLESLAQLAAVNEQRFKSGDVGEVTVLQSRVEANQFRAEVLDAEGAVRASDLTLVGLLGGRAAGSMGHAIDVGGDLTSVADRTFSAPSLVRDALARRPDLLAARRRAQAAAKQIDLARANRIIDIGVGATWQHNFAIVGQQGPLPTSDFLGATVSVPLPFSRMYRGELDTAIATQRQSEALTSAATLRVEIDVRTAITKYEAAAARVKLYTGGVLADADAVLEKTLYNYRRGGATLVEVLVAQRTDNDVHLSYFDALADAGHALVAVQQAIGAWDIDL